MQPNDDELPKLYGGLSWLWPILSPPEDYVEEATIFVNTIRQYARRETKTLLDLGCGGGHNDLTLKEHFQVTGVDLSEGMLALARELNPEVEYELGDMRTARLGREFDAVAIFDSVDYMLSEQDLRKAFLTAWVHLRPGGVLITYLEETKESFENDKTRVDRRIRGEVDLTYVEHLHDPSPEDTTYQATMVYLVRRGGKMEVYVDESRLGLFHVNDVVNAMAESGFVVELLSFRPSGSPGCPMLVGTRPL